MVEQDLSGATLDEWIASQQPWPVDTAICLLLRMDPKTFKKEVRAKRTDQLLVVQRALTALSRALTPPLQSLSDLSESKSTKRFPHDCAVYKRDFIAWAEKDWDDDATHLTDALKRYDALSEKPWRKAPQTRTDITHRVFLEVFETLSPSERMSISNRKLHRRMSNRPDSENIYSLTAAVPLLSKWREAFKGK